MLFAAGLYTKYKDLPNVSRGFKGIELAVFAMIIAVALKLININQLADFKSALIIVLSFVMFMFTKVHPALIILGAGSLGIIFLR